MMHFKCGVFTSPTSTGEADFDTGLAGQVTALFLTSAGSTALATVEDEARISFGATDGTTQWAVSAGVVQQSPVVDGDDVMDTAHSNTAIVRIINSTGTVLAEAEFVSASGGVVTLDWTVAPASAIEVAFMAWDQVTALAGVTLVDSGNSNDYVIDVSSAISDLKVVLGANQRDVNDGTIRMGAAEPATNRGAGYQVRVDVSNDFEAEAGAGDGIASWTQAATTGIGGADARDFTDTSFTIHVSTTNLTFTAQPVGWLAIGDGGSWFPQDDPLRTLLDVNEPLSNDSQIPLGMMLMSGASVGTAGQEHRTACWSAWDNTDNQYAVINYLERDTSGVRSAVTGRATYDDRAALFLTNKTTVGGSLSLTDDGAGGPHSTVTGSTPLNDHALYFVYLTPDEPLERFWAVLV